MRSYSPVSTDAILASLEVEGFAIVSDVVPPELCDEAEATMASTREAARELSSRGELDETYVFGNIKEREHRFDVKLSLAEPVVRSVLEVTLAKLEPVVSEFVMEEGKLCELGSLHSLPGSRSQPAHADTHGSSRCCLTAFTALCDVLPEKGPTELWPGSHLRPDEMSADAVLAEHGDGVPALLTKGATLLMDSRLIHRGSANSSKDAERLLFYTSWLLPGATAAGSTHSIFPEYGARFRLSGWRSWIVAPPPTTAWDLALLR